MHKLLMTSAVLMFAAIVGPVSAQDPAQAQEKPDSIVLETKVGSVLTSSGGDFRNVQEGKVLVQGESMMLSDGAKATVVYYYYYDEGKRFRKCVEKYAGPDTFVIDDNCKAAVAWLNSGPSGTAMIVGGAVVAAALLAGGNGNDAAPPISAGAR